MKLCRFCGVKPYLFSIIGNSGECLYYCKCGQCGLITERHKEQQDALTEWDEINSRVY